METTTLNNGVKMPILGFGTYQITDPEECERTVINALEAGYRLIDTAQAYGNEEAVGAGIKNCGVDRKELFVTTKVWFRSYESDDCKKSLELSMKKLGVDYLDMVLLHWPFGNVYAAWRVLEDYYKKGVIRAIGVSNMETDRLIDLMEFNEIKPVLNQIETNLYCQRKKEHEWMERYGIAHQAYAPLGQGRANQMFQESAVKQIAEKDGKSAAQVLLRFLVQSHVAVIPKSVHKERIIENINIFDFELSAEDMAALRSLDTAKAMIGNPEAPELVENAMTW